jgi:hypothetical protein
MVIASEGIMTTPAGHERRLLSADETRRDRILVRDAADIDRLIVRLFTRRDVPRIEIGTDRFPQLVAQRTQDRFGRLAEACNCMFGEVAAGTTLLCGTFAVWVSSSDWRHLLWVLLAAAGLAVVGKGIELAWTRLRMLLLLRDLLRRSDTATDLPASKPVGHEWLESGHRVTPPPSAAMTVDAPVARARSRAHRALRRPRVQLHNVADIRRMHLHLVTKWSIPRIEIQVDGVPGLAVQRAQHLCDRLSGSPSYMLAGVMTALTLLGGSLYAVWKLAPDGPPSQALDQWLAVPGWGNVQPVVAAALLAGLFGWVIERALVRVRLLWVLRGLRQHEQFAE